MYLDTIPEGQTDYNHLPPEPIQVDKLNPMTRVVQYEVVPGIRKAGRGHDLIQEKIKTRKEPSSLLMPPESASPPLLTMLNNNLPGQVRTDSSNPVRIKPCKYLKVVKGLRKKGWKVKEKTAWAYIQMFHPQTGENTTSPLIIQLRLVLFVLFLIKRWWTW